MLYTLTIILIAIISLVLIVFVLLQSGQGGGLSGGIAGNVGGGGGAGNMLGARRTADFLSKSTSVLGATLLVLCVLANFFIDRGPGEGSTLQQRGVQTEQQQDFSQPSETAPAIPVQPGESNGDNDE